MTYTTTLKRLRKNNACARGYDLIASHVGPDFGGDIDLLTILEVNGLDDCIWAFRATDGGTELATLFAIKCARRVYDEPSWNKWADDWESGKDRSEASGAWEAREAMAARAASEAREAWEASAAMVDRAARAAREAMAARAARAAWAARAAREARAAELLAQKQILTGLLKGE